MNARLRSVPLLAVDADANPNLGISLGIGSERTYALVGTREALLPLGPAIASPMEDVVDRFASAAGDRLRILQVSKYDSFKPG